MKLLLCAVFINASILGARNPFQYEPIHQQNVVDTAPCCIGEGVCGDERLTLIRMEDGELRVIKEKVPSTLGKAEGLGG